MRWAVMVAAGLLGVAAMGGESRAKPAPKVWDAAGAARYLDGRLAWWRQWPKAQRDHGTVCVSCHTALPHVLARPALRAQLGEHERSPAESAMMDDVVKRVWLWREVEPFYTDQRNGMPKSSEARGVEGVLNALILSTRDAERGALGTDTRQAFAQMWAQQLQAGEQKGGFAWLNFHLEPWESPSASYWGATLAAVAVARAPGYAADPAQVEALRAYLRGGMVGQSLYTRALLLWADSALHGVLTPEQRQGVIADITAAQGADGGWSLPALGAWQRVDKSALPTASDGYATAMMAMVLREAGLGAEAPGMKAARGWLVAHQDKASGAVPAVSINKDRAPGSDPYLFMSDEATGMAALALRPGG